MSLAQRMAPLALSFLAAGCSSGEVPARSALLITLEATRRDALGIYGGAPSVTPNLDRLAGDAIRYEWARSVAPLSRPAHASIATGLYPPRHGLRSGRSQALADRAETVAERARGAGFETAAFVGSRLLDQSSGLLQGFQRLGAPPAGDTAQGELQERSAAEVVAEATAWLQGRARGRPFFLWVHCCDAHLPRHARVPDAPEPAPYRAELAELDRALGALFAELAAQDLYGETFVAVAGANGEGLGEHGETGQGLGLWDSTLRVPLFLRYRDGYGAGEVSSEVVSVVDLAPTLLEALGLGAPAGLDGTSLYYQSVASDRGVYFESYAGWERFGWSPLVGVADAQGKLACGARDEFFDLRRDPLELAPLALADGGPERYRAFLSAARAEPLAAEDDPAQVSPALLAELQQLGYAPPAAVPRYPLPEELAGRKDPRDCLAEHESLERARALVGSGDFEAALPLLEGLRAANPAAREVLDVLAAALLGMERHERAVEVLRARLCHPPERMETHRDLRICFTALGQAERARAHSIRALELLAEHQQRGGDVEALRRTRVLLDQTRRADAAELGVDGAQAGSR